MPQRSIQDPFVEKNVMFRVPQISKEITDTIQQVLQEVQTVDPPTQLILEEIARPSSFTDHGGNREGCSRGRGHYQSLVEVQVEPTFFLVFNFQCVRERQGVCAHRLAKHGISHVTSSSYGVRRQKKDSTWTRTVLNISAQ